MDGALALQPVYSCVRFIAEGVGKTPVLQYRDTGKRKVKMPPGPFITSPSSYLRPFDWKVVGMTSVLLHGMGIALVTSRDGYGYPLAAEWLPKDQVTITDSQPFNPLKAKYYYAGRPVAREDLFVIRGLSVPGRTEAISPIRAFQSYIESGHNALDYGAGWYRSGGFPPGVFKNSQYEVTDDQSAEIKGRLVRAIRRHEPLVHGSDWEFNPITVPPNEAQFIESMQLNATQIASIYGVQPRRAGGVHGDSMTYCADTATEILTIEGWRRYDQVQPGDVCLTLNTGTGLSEWQPVGAVNVFDGPHDVIKMRNSTHSSVTTPGHRWPVMISGRPGCRDGWQWRTSETLPRDARICAAAPVAAPAEAKWSDAVAELAAWFWTEGWIGRHGQVVITQSSRVNPHHVNRIRAALAAVFGPPADKKFLRSRPAWRESRDERGMNRFHLNVRAARLLLDIAPGKVVTTGFLAELTRAQLELFIATSLDADGSVMRHPGGTSSMHLAQADLPRLEAFQVACTLAGRSAVIHGPGKNGMWSTTVQRSPWRKPNGHPEYVTRKGTDGPVWCPTTPNGTWFARREGTIFATGNSNVEMDAISEVTDTLDPWLVRFEEAYFECLPRPQLAEFDRDARIRHDIRTRYDVYRVARDIGVMNVDEVRDLEDREPLPKPVNDSDYDGKDFTPLQIQVAAARGLARELGVGVEGEPPPASVKTGGIPEPGAPAQPGAQPPKMPGPVKQVPPPVPTVNGKGRPAR